MASPFGSLNSPSSRSSPPPIVSPVKRQYRASPSSSPDPARDTESSSPRVLRTKLSSSSNRNGGGEEVRLELNLQDVRGAKEVRVECVTPSTPPEQQLEALVGLGVGLSGASGLKEEGEEHQDGSTQTATAERQQMELMQMSVDKQVLLAKLCSQAWTSEYNTLKRAVAAAAHEAVQQQARPPPSYPSLPRVPSVPAFVAQAAFHARPAHDRPPLPPRAASDSVARAAPSTPSSAALPSASTALTPIISNFTFDPSTPSTSALPTPVSSGLVAPSPATPSATAVSNLLADLVQGEPVKVQKTTHETVVVSETLPVQPPEPCISGLLPGMRVVNGVAVKTSISHPINISPLVPPELLPYLSSQLFPTLSSSSSSSSASSASTLSSSTPFLLRPTSSTDLLTLSTSSTLPPSPTTPPPKLGNFVLSSCPGKKVRMNGEPIKGGRGAICRDVVVDLRRARDEYGVRVVVCCLDDTELAYLGVPWPSYISAAHSLGLSVIRLPCVEGYAFESPQFLDGHLARIVRDYTLKGKSVLAHCRGGIGRAGLVAASWMLKMGMVTTAKEGGRGGFGEEDTMEVVVKVIELIRKRRSVKAIETAHQVHFLVQYVQYLQQHATPVTASELVSPLPSSSAIA